MKASQIVLLCVVVLASGCVNSQDSPNSKSLNENNEDESNQKLNYTELEKTANSISHSNLVRYPEGHRGKTIREHGKIFQVSNNGFLMASRAIYTGRTYEYASDIVWVTTSRETPLIQKDEIVTVFGEYKGTKTYETSNGEFRTVPQMDMNYITDKVDVTVRADTYGGENIPDRVNKLCADSKCVKNVSEHTFRLAINEEHNFWIEDERFEKVNKTKRISSKTGFPLGAKIKNK